jgi:hypothetical protein
MKTTFFLLLFVCTSAPWKTYTDATNHFAIDYPETWEQQEKNGILVFLSPLEGSGDTFRENVNLLLQTLTDEVKTMDQYTVLTKQQVIDQAGEKAIVSLKDVKLGAHPAKEFIYNATFNGRSLKVKQYWFIKGKSVYLFTYTADPLSFDKYEGPSTALIRSFRFQ